jgi:hypothetical protein
MVAPEFKSDSRDEEGDENSSISALVGPPRSRCSKTLAMGQSTWISSTSKAAGIETMRGKGYILVLNCEEV